MSHPQHKSYSLSLPAEMSDAQKEMFQHFMNEQARAQNEYTEAVQKELNCSVSCAMDVVYLRGRSRWSPELEDKLIAEHKSGRVVNIMEFGN